MLDNQDNGNRRFFLTDASTGLVEVVKNASSADVSPFVVMESDVEGSGTLARPVRTYPVYFFVRARGMAKGDDAAEAKEEAYYHARNFLAWLKVKHDKEVAANIDGDFARVNVDDTYFDFNSVGPIENGWYAVLIQPDREEPLNLCIDPSLYTEPV